MVIRPFRLWDAGLVGRLQRDGVSLDLETRLTQSWSPLRIALLSRVPLVSNDVWTCIIDYKEDHTAGQGLAQMRQRPGRPEYVVSFVSPALTAGNGTHATWQRLLSHLCVKAGECGAQRVYAGLPPEGEEYQVFRHMGFAPFAQEEVYAWSPGGAPLEIEPLPLRVQRERDGWGLQRLYSVATPRPVQNAEGLAQGEWDLSQHIWGTSPRRRGYVWEDKGDIGAAVQIRSSRRAHWIRILLHPDEANQAEALLAAATSNVRCHSGQNLYCAVRTYDSGMSRALAAHGFQIVGTQTMMVKHCTSWVRKFTPQPLPSLDAQVEHTARLEYFAREALSPGGRPYWRIEPGSGLVLSPLREMFDKAPSTNGE